MRYSVRQAATVALCVALMSTYVSSYVRTRLRACNAIRVGSSNIDLRWCGVGLCCVEGGGCSRRRASSVCAASWRVFG